MQEIVRVAEDRIPAVVGKGGRTKAAIEKWTGTHLDISDVVRIEGDDPMMVLKARDMVTALGRGFSMKDVKRLLEDDCCLHVISLGCEKQKKRERLFARVIGNGGVVKKRIEEESGALVCIRGKTLSIIGKPDEVQPAEKAVEELLLGKTHAWAYKAMRMRKEKRRPSADSPATY
jgi:ribosomal RNA assembly protein